MTKRVTISLQIFRVVAVRSLRVRYQSQLLAGSPVCRTIVVVSDVVGQ